MDNEGAPPSPTSERTPLISSFQQTTSLPTQQQQQALQRNSSGNNQQERRPVIAVAPVNADEQPVPMAPSAMTAVGGVPTINCRICRALIGLDGKLGDHVVKCPTCNEATPIRAAPEGKRYVRCPCGCLLVCKQSASRISCPRDHCRRVLNLTAPTSTPSSEAEAVQRMMTSGQYRTTNAGANQLVVSHLQCPSCFLSFLLQSDPSTPYASCPHCSARAVLHQSYVRRRLVILGVLALLFLCGGIATMVTTWEYTVHDHNYALIAAWASLLLACVACAIGAIYFGMMKVAKVMTSATTSYGANGNGRYAYA